MPRILCYLLCCVVLSVPVSSFAVTFKIATIAPEGSQWMQQMRAAALTIKEQTAGRVKIKYYGGGVMGNEKSVLRKMRVGQLHGGAFTGGGLSFGFASGGYANLMSQEPIHSVADMKGLKVWVPEGDRVSYAVMESLGLAPVTLPLSDVLTGLQTGLVEVVGTSPLGALAFQWYTRVNYITPMPLAYVYGSLVIDKRSFNRLSATDQTVVREVLSAMYRNFDQQNSIDNNNAMQALQAQGLTVVQPLEGEYERWSAVAQQQAHKMAAQGLYSPEIYEQIQSNLQCYRCDEVETK